VANPTTHQCCNWLRGARGRVSARAGGRPLAGQAAWPATTAIPHHCQATGESDSAICCMGTREVGGEATHPARQAGQAPPNPPPTCIGCNLEHVTWSMGGEATHPARQAGQAGQGQAPPPPKRTDLQHPQPPAGFPSTPQAMPPRRCPPGNAPGHPPATPHLCIFIRQHAGQCGHEVPQGAVLGGTRRGCHTWGAWVCGCADAHACARVCMCVCVCVWMHKRGCVCMCVCI